MQEDRNVKAAYDAAHMFTRRLVEDPLFRTTNRSIPAAAVNPLTDLIQLFVAEVIQAWIDAGSERDATMENEELRNAIHDELKGWSDGEVNG